MSHLFEDLSAKVKASPKYIVFPEGLDERVLTAASQLGSAGVLTPILLGDKMKIKQQAEAIGVDVTSCRLMDPHNFEAFDLMVETFVERRNGKVTEAEAREILLQENYFGTMLVYMNQADGLVSGAVHSTADTVRPALQIIKTKDGISKTSGVFVMVRGEEKYIFADCAINMAPSSEDLAEIAVASAETADLFAVDPRIAMLSFSTKGSAQSEETDKVKHAVALAREKQPALLIDGELQFDAAFVPEVAEKKAPDSGLKGNANVFIFPNLEAGNIGYKMVERLGDFEAVGPVLQGLNRPVNDLSRGCSTEDVYKLALITAAQAQ